MKNSILGKLLIISMFLSVGNYAFAHDFEVNGIYYGLSIFNKNTAYVTHQGKNYNDYNEYSGSVVIPESVTYKGKTYAVQSIGGYAFYGCNGLTSVTIPKTVNTINQNAFNGCTGLKSIVCNATTPPSLLENAFTSYSGISLKVPVESESAYKSTAGWNQFMINIYAVSGLNYKIINATSAEVTFGTAKYSGDLTIPEQISIEGKTYAVTSIGENAFNGCTGLNSIVIPKSITNIASNAFINCTGLKTIIYNAVACSSNVSGIFSSCSSLTKLVIGESVSDLSVALFSGCKSLATVEFNATNCSAVGENTFASCGSLTKLIIGEKVKSLPNGAFKSCTALTTVEFNAIQCTSIGNGSHPAFEGCTKLTTLTFGAKVTTIPEFAFNKSSALKSISIPNSVTSIGRYAFGECAAVTSLTIGNSLTTIPEGTFSGCAALTSVVIPNSVKTIENYAFYTCTGLKTLTIGNAVTSIGEYAFAYCKALTSVVLPNSVKTLGNYAFAWTSGLTSVTFGSSVANIGNYAFSEATALTSVTSLNPTPPVCGTDVFMRVSTSTIPLVMPVGSESLYKTAATWKDFKYKATVGDTVEVLGLNYKITSASTVEVVAGTEKYSGNITIPASVTIDGTTYSVTQIGEKAFYDCSGLTSITIPNSVTGIGDWAFVNCSSLGRIEIPNSAISIGDSAFSNCTGLTNITIPNSVTSIGDYAFRGCTGLTSVTSLNPTPPTCGTNVFGGVNVANIPLTVPSGSESQYQSADQWKDFGTITGYASTLTYNILNSTDVEVVAGTEKYTGDIVIPSTTVIDGNTYNVTQIGERAFYSFTGLTSITIPNSVTSIGNYAFYFCTGLTSVTIPNSVTSIGNTAFYGCSGLTSITIGNSVTSIGNSAFDGCSGLTSITIPNSVTGIGNSAFYGCSGLTSITIPNSVTSIGNGAFYYCRGLTSITIPNSVTSIGTNPFTGCYSLTSIVVDSGNTKYDSRNNCNAIIETSTNTLISGCKNTIIPNSVTSIGNYAFRNCTGLTSITIPNSVTGIGGYAFHGCTGLTNITIPNSVTSIGADAFNGCSGLTSITIPNSVASIGINPFTGCNNLSSIVVESGNTKYDSRDNSNAIIEISTNTLISGCISTVIPNSVTSIGNSAFEGCSGLTSIEIPNSVTSIGNYAFQGCTGLTSVASLNPTPPTCGTGVFSGVNVANIPLTVPSGSESQYQSAEQWKDFGTIKGIEEESGVITDPVITKLWTVPADATTGLCSSRTVSGYGDVLYGVNNTAGTIEEWKDGQLVASYDVNKFCADNQLGEIVQISDDTGNVTEKFQSYVLWTALMMDDVGNILVNIGINGLGNGASANNCQNWVLLPVEDRTKMQLLHIDEFPSADVTLGRVDVPSRIIGNITDGGAYLYITPSQSAIMPVMFIGPNDEGQIFYGNELSWSLMSSVAFDSSTNVATFMTFDEILCAADECEVAAKTYVRWRGQGPPFTWNAETTQFEKNYAIPQGSGTPGMDVFEIAGVKYMVLPIKSPTNGYRGCSVAVYNLSDGTEVASWDSGATTDYYIGSVQARVNADGRSANIYVCGHKDCFGILRFGSASSVSSLGENSLNSGAGSSAIEEVTSAETEGEVEYYNLQGVRVMNPERGLYIKHQGGKTSKVVL